MQPARFRQADFLLVEINNAKSTSPAVSSREERELFSWTAAGNRAYRVAGCYYITRMVIFAKNARLFLMTNPILSKQIFCLPV